MTSQYLSQNSDNAGNVQTIVNQMIRKEAEYRDEISNNADLVRSAALRLVKNGAFEKLFQNSNGGDGEDDPLKEERDRLKALTKSNIERNRDITAFLQALQYIGDHSNDENTENYQAELEQRLAIERKKNTASKRKRRSSAGGVEDYMREPMYQDLCRRLGEPVPGSDGNKDDDEEEELEIVDTGASGADLKCPITGSLFQDPVRNRECNHVYSKVAIEQHIARATRKNCPVTGCGNRNVTKSQLEPDRETAILVRRETKRLEREQQHRLHSQATVDVGEEDDEDDHGGLKAES